MKKHNCIIRIEGQLEEVTIFSELSARDLKKENSDIVTITESSRVSHPSPAIIVEAMNELGYNITDFYAACYQAEKRNK